MKGTIIILIALLLLTCKGLYAQNLVWTGSADLDFFNENNWQEQTGGATPASGTIDPQKDISLNLFITNASAEITASELVQLGSGKLTIEGSVLNATAISGGGIQINNAGYVNLSTDDPLQNGVTVNITSGIAWLRTTQIKGTAFYSMYLGNVTVNGNAASYPTNIRLDNYYQNGTIVRAELTDTKPLTIFDQANQQGNGTDLTVNDIHSGASMPGSMNNKTASFKLRKGYMATMAIDDDGTNMSKVYIASENDLEIDDLPNNLKNDISFIRVVPWNWVSKKGIGGNVTGLNETWHYIWGNGGVSTVERENAPMAWGKSGADDDSDIELYKSKYKATHVMAFNESDNCNDQSGKWGDLCQTDVAVATYKNLMKTGLRLVSPSCRENAPFGWLKEFRDKATAQNIRIDVIGVHWYDWGSTPANSPNADPQQVFDRFKSYLQRVYEEYHLPIWITEFNANPNRTTAVNKAFMELALPYLESLDYVERYAWFEPSSDVADYYDAQGNYTQVGLVYKNRVSTPSIPEDILASSNNLDNSSNDKSIVFEDYFETYTNGQDLSSFYTVWAGPANAVDGTQTSTWGTADEGNGFGKSNDTKEAFYLRKAFTLEAGKAYIWELATKMTDGEKHSLNVLPGDIYPKKECYNSTWEKHSIEFTVQADNTSVTLALYRWPKKNLYFDNFVLKEKDYNTATYDIDQFKEVGVLIYPNPVKEILNIKLDDDRQSNGIFRIYNVYGNPVMQGLQATSIDVSSLSAGIYFFMLGNRMAKFIKY